MNEEIDLSKCTGFVGMDNLLGYFPERPLEA